MTTVLHVLLSVSVTMPDGRPTEILLHGGSSVIIACQLMPKQAARKAFAVPGSHGSSVPW